MKMNNTILSLAGALAISGAFIGGIYFGRKIEVGANANISAKAVYSSSYQPSYYAESSSDATESDHDQEYDPSYTPAK